MANRCLSENNDMLWKSMKVNDIMKVKIVSKETNSIKKKNLMNCEALKKLNTIQQSI